MVIYDKNTAKTWIIAYVDKILYNSEGLEKYAVALSNNNVLLYVERNLWKNLGIISGFFLNPIFFRSFVHIIKNTFYELLLD